MRLIGRVALSVVAACLASAPALAGPTPQLTVDVPLVASATTATPGAGTALQLWPGVRVGALAPLGAPFVCGADLTLAGTFQTAGTPLASATTVLGGLEARGLLGASFGGRMAGLTPFLWTSMLGATGPRVLVGGTTTETRWRFLPGARVGAGAIARVWHLQARLDVGGGWLWDRPELAATLALGVHF